MAHFAQITNSIVTDIIVVNNDVLNSEYPISEAIGQAFIASLGLEGTWLQSSYNNRFRKQHAGIGFTYDETKNEFVAPKPFASWLLDANNDWQPPSEKPEGNYDWNEETLSWIFIDDFWEQLPDSFYE